MKPAHKLAIAAAVLIGGWWAANYGLALYHDPARSNPDKSIVLLTTSWCPYCSVLRNSLQQSGVPFRELDNWSYDCHLEIPLQWLEQQN
jgi:hypothetical protein